MTTTTLYRLLKETDVVIPIIQRDYAQGRKGKEFIRKSFLGEIKSHIENHIENHIEKNEKLSLDFVYGNNEQNSFRPLDGQQRLTTLWLIHWYLSLKSNKLNEDKEWLSKFTYETRISSREFCKSICNPDNMKNINEKRVSDYIKNQNWFFSDWLQDPTIAAMLRTIGGDSESCNDDCVEGVFKDIDFDEFRNRLINDDVITFEKMEIGSEKLPISDELYIKMNARGKVLTDFENFKADFVAWIQNSRIDATNEIPKNIDNAWTDVFWKFNHDGKIDEIFFSFINRFFLNEICLSGSEDYKKLLDLDHYEGFAVYERYLKNRPEAVKNLNRILLLSKEGLDKVKNSDDNYTADKENQKYVFIPIYNEDGTLKDTTLKERVYFLAVCLFLIGHTNENFNDDSFRRWIRVAGNLIENAEIDNVDQMKACLETIKEIGDKIAEGDWNVYDVLKDWNNLDRGNAITRQMKEEIQKAGKICEEPEWEGKIEEAERYAFFNGCIRFLYRDDRGNVSWDKFDERFKNAKEYFTDDDKNKVKPETIRSFLGYFKNFSEIDGKYLFTSIGSHPRNACWKRSILCNDDLKANVNSFLLKEETPCRDSNYEAFFSNEELIKYIVNKSDNHKYKSRYYGAQVHKDSSQKEYLYLGESCKNKSAVLKSLVDEKKISIDKDVNPLVGGYYWGKYVLFTYEGKKYSWDPWKEGKIINSYPDNKIITSEWNKPEELLKIIDKAEQGVSK